MESISFMDGYYILGEGNECGMRQRISEKNIFPSFSLETEYRKLHDLLFDRRAFGVRLQYSLHSKPSLSYNDCLSELFLEWKLRGSFTSIEEMLSSLQIGETEFQQECDENRLLDYIQFVANAVVFVNQKADDIHGRIYQAGTAIPQAVSEQCMLIAEKLNAEIIYDGLEFYVKYKNSIAEAVAMKQPELEASVMEYLKIDNRGDLVRKGEILCSLGKQLELLENDFKGTEFSSLFSDTKLILNKAGPRHALMENDHIEIVFMHMDTIEREKWYDKAFNMFIACMAAVPYLGFKNEIRELKRQ